MALRTDFPPCLARRTSSQIYEPKCTLDTDNGASEVKAAEICSTIFLCMIDCVTREFDRQVGIRDDRLA